MALGPCSQICRQELVSILPPSRSVLKRKRTQRHHLPMRRPNSLRFGQQFDQPPVDEMSGWGKSPIEKHLEKQQNPF